LTYLALERGGMEDCVHAALQNELKRARRIAKQALCDWLTVEFAVVHMDMVEVSGTADVVPLR
jgi:hypothetical protein